MIANTHQDVEAKETTYTIFCPDTDDSDPPECDLSLEFPFVLVEGPDTVRFHGTHTSRLYVLCAPTTYQC
jgi:hypothetical protein